MLKEIFSHYSDFLSEGYKSFLLNNLKDIAEIDYRIFNSYLNYAIEDSNFPRPILTLLGVNHNTEKIPDISTFSDINLLFIPQLIRDFLAIHDDIIDEDLVKFNNDTLPFSFSKFVDNQLQVMSKYGKDMSLLFGDYLLSLPYKIVCELNVDADIKIRIIKLINCILTTTNLGQMTEMLWDKRNISDISEIEMFEMYKRKAADYCYAFPFELGLRYANVPSELVDASRNILLNIGACSQIVNDLEGIFFENFSNERQTLSDILCLKRSYLLVKLWNKTKDNNIKSLLSKTVLNHTEGIQLKTAIINQNIIADVVSDVEKISEGMKTKISFLSVSDIIKDYFLDLIDIRIVANLHKL